MGSPQPVIMVSALQHYCYCPRQCALIHVEQVYEENLHTIQGNWVHDQAHESGTRLREERLEERNLPLWSEKLGLVGRTDVVEFHDGVPFPVEYKKGKLKNDHGDRVQLCAQAICLEEMLDCAAPEGALFYHGSRRRQNVEFTSELRAAVRKNVDNVREMIRAEQTPPPVNDQRCPPCSLKEQCMPELNDWNRDTSGGNFRQSLFDPELA